MKSGIVRCLSLVFMTIACPNNGWTGEYSLAPMRTAPKIDGLVEPAEWSDALQVSGFVDREGRLVTRHGSFSIGRTDKALYFAIVSELPPEGQLLARVKRGNKSDPAVALDDTVEIWIAPQTGANDAEKPVHQLMLNANDAVYSTKHDRTANPVISAWNPKAQYKSQFHDGFWHIEVEIPLGDLHQEDAALNGILFRVVRSWRQPHQPSASEGFATNNGFADLTTMSRLRFSDSAPFIHQSRIADAEKREVDLKLDIHGIVAASKVHAKAEMLSSSNMAPRVVTREVELEKGKSETLGLTSELWRDIDFTMSLLLTSAEDEGVLFRRDLTFSTFPPEDSWAVRSAAAASQFQVAYSPYRHQLLIKALGAVRPDSVKITMKDSKKTVFEKKIATENWADSIGKVELPPLAPGQYSLTLRAEEKNIEETVPLQVETFEWEKNTIGEGKGIPSPFTPVEVEGDRARVLLREYKFAPSGLLADVLAEGTSLLKAESVLTARIGENIYTATGSDFRLVADDQGGAEFFAQWKLGEVQGTTKGSISYDGLIRYDLTLPAAAGGTLDALTLRIPVSGKEASLMHAIGAGIRGNFAGAVAKGEGVIWNNLEAMAYGYPDSFIPYLWVGGIRRGLAVMADSITNWSINAEESSTQLVREGDTLWMELRLISKPVKLDRERTVTLYTQATPIKEKPANWRRFVGRDRFQNAETLIIHASCPYWGAVSKYSDVYPRDRDFEYLQKIVEAQKARKITPDIRDFIEQWNKGYAGLREEKLLRDHVRIGFNIATTADRMVPYTDARSVRENLPEFQIFQDEWIQQGFTARKWADDPTGIIKTAPVRSYQDYALWYFQKMKDIGYASGIYFDNDFLLASQNPFETYERTLANGEDARPSVGLMTLREYFQRAYSLFTDGDSRAMNVLHMTNAAIAPHLAFSTIQLDWEMKYGSEDFQDRFKEDYIFASSLGEQFGTMPWVLTGIYASKEKSANWLTRTLFAVTGIYELTPWPSFQADMEALRSWYEILYDFGYGTESCEVYRYWENPPYSLNRKDAKAIVMKADDKILCIVSDFGEGGETALTLEKSLIGGKNYSAKNVETGEPIEWDGKKFRLDLKKHDFSIILLEPTT